MESVAEKVRRVVERDPIVRECLSRGLASISAVSRVIAARIASETGSQPSLSSVKMAVSRLARSLRAGHASRGVEAVLAKSALAVQDRVAVVSLPISRLDRAVRAVYELAPASRFLQLVESTSAVTLMVSEEDLDRVLSIVGDPLEVLRDQSAVIVVSPREIIETPGVVAYLTSYLAGYGINITQIVSAYLDTIIVVSRRDAPRAYNALHSLIYGLQEALEHGEPPNY